MSKPELHADIDLTIARAFVAELADYLKADVLYWPVTRSHPLGDKMPQLTIGGLLEALVRAEAAQNDLTADQRGELHSIRAEHDRIRDDRPVAYGNKAAREINSRLDAWSQYLDDAARKPADVAAYYPHEVRARAKAYLLTQQIERDLPQNLRQRLALLDTRLQPLFKAGAFVWDDRLQVAFPQSSCWWLYGRLPD